MFRFFKRFLHTKYPPNLSNPFKQEIHFEKHYFFRISLFCFPIGCGYLYYYYEKKYAISNGYSKEIKNFKIKKNENSKYITNSKSFDYLIKFFNENPSKVEAVSFFLIKFVIYQVNKFEEYFILSIVLL